MLARPERTDGAMTRVVLPLLIVLLLLGSLTAALSEHPWSPRRDVVRPIPFSHRVHAGENQIPCQYCHEYARRSQTAGIRSWPPACWRGGPLMSPRPQLPRLAHAGQMLYLYLLLIPMAAVSAPIALGTTVIYPWYAEGPHPLKLSAVTDQQIGGLLMWVGAGLYLMAYSARSSF